MHCHQMNRMEKVELVSFFGVLLPRLSKKTAVHHCLVPMAVVPMQTRADITIIEVVGDTMEEEMIAVIITAIIEDSMMIEEEGTTMKTDEVVTIITTIEEDLLQDIMMIEGTMVEDIKELISSFGIYSTLLLLPYVGNQCTPIFWI